MRTLIFAMLLSTPIAQSYADDSADKFFAKMEAEALKKLERGNPNQKIDAASTMEAENAPKAAVALAPLLAHKDRDIRFGAADALWTLAGKDGDISAAIPALKAMLLDSDSAVAMQAAGALASAGIPETELAGARRRVLSGPPQSHDVQFLAARGLIGIDPSADVLPYLLAYYFDAVEDAKLGGSDDAVELATNAIEQVVVRNELDTIPVLEEALSATPAATGFLLEQLARFDPKPADWVGLLLEYTDQGYRDTRATAFELLGNETEPAALSRWLPKAVPLLEDARLREIGLDALDDAAGKSDLGLDALAALAGDAGAKREHRLQAIEILSDAADTSQHDGVAAVKATAYPIWYRLCDSIINQQSPDDDEFKACHGDSSWLIADDAKRARQWADWLTHNSNVETKLLFLGQLEGMWSRAAPALPAVHAARQHADPRVVAAAEAALNRIEPAWRERRARASAPAPVATPNHDVERPATGSGRSGKPADGAALYDAIRTNNLAAVKKLVRADNVAVPVQFGQIPNAPLPIQAALNFCGVPQSAQALPLIVEYLISIGANPDVPNADGMSALDMAKYACPESIMRILAGAPAS
ncbi:hypothetical protein C7S18_03015 [Ahniella affigens]|uniref:Uncharacterized protein n=1 Tax=Ahniella affigens TaxID=2021234 RepID=A0A2P1PN03_9GAMM|nr:ankyrin repeat domain-containing protein [Ahniella affigens]AVP96226.1 hypothetical protein C7S18_03015 [Ahniella affigens]